MTTAHDALDLARRHGVVVQARDDRLRLRAPKPPPPDVLEALRFQKANILALLCSPPPLDADGIPCGPCPACGGRAFWRWPERHSRHAPRDWRCDACSPTPPGTGMCDACAVPTEGEHDD